MVVSKKALGRGFDSLIPTDVLDETFDPTAARDEQMSELRYIQLDEISSSPDQPRRHFDDDAMAELASSIKEHGILQPIVVSPQTGGYVIVAGERRWRAARLAGLSKLPAIVRTLSSQHKLELALIENLQREDLNPMETATAYMKLKTQFNMTQEEIGQRVGGKSVASISNFMRLLQLPDFAKKAVAEGQISEGHARQILALTGDETAQKDLMEQIVREGWSVRKAEQYVIGYKKASKAGDTKRDRAIRSTRIHTEFTKQLTKRLSLPVVQKTMAKGGQIIICYSSDAELSELEKKLL